MMLYIVKISENKMTDWKESDIKNVTGDMILSLFDNGEGYVAEGDCFYIEADKAFLDEHLENDILPFRKEKVLLYKNDPDKYRGIAASYALKKAIEDAGFTDKLEPSYSESGKMYLKDKDGNIPFYISISHAGEYAVCFLSDKECGADIESVSRIKRLLDKKGDKADAFVRRFLNDDEYDEYLRIKEDGDASEYVTKCWTKKEAYSKYTGRGLAEIV